MSAQTRWKFYVNDGEDPSSGFVVEDAATNTNIAIVGGMGQSPEDERRNAKLIIAAPEMADALTALVTRFGTIEDQEIRDAISALTTAGRKP